MIKLFLFFIILVPTYAHALNLTGYHFSDSFRYAIVDDSMLEKYPGHFVFSTSAAYVKSPFFEADILNNKVSRNIIDYNQITTAGGTYYLSNMSAVTLKTAYVQNRVYNIKHHSLADSELKGRFNIYKEGAHSVSINPVFTFPTGQKSNYTTTGTVGGGIAAVGEMKIEQVMLQGSLGYYNASSNKALGINYSELITSTLAISWDFKPEWTINLETYRNFTVAADTGQDEGEYYLTVKNSSVKGMSFFGGAGIAGLYSPYSSNTTYFVGLRFFDFK
ncbi:MAG: hypothetical protein ACOYL6_06970 [Bacteriovoracaceae bacterium]